MSRAGRLRLSQGLSLDQTTGRVFHFADLCLWLQPGCQGSSRSSQQSPEFPSAWRHLDRRRVLGYMLYVGQALQGLVVGIIGSLALISLRQNPAQAPGSEKTDNH